MTNDASTTADVHDSVMAALEARLAGMKRGVRGFDPDEVRALVSWMSESFREVWDRCRELEGEVASHRARAAELDEERQLLHDVLLRAQRTARETVSSAKVDAQGITDEARRTLDRAAIERAEIIGDAERRAKEIQLEAERGAVGITAAAQTELLALRQELTRLRDLEREMHAGLHGFLRAAFELLDEHRVAAREHADAVEAIVEAPARSAAGDAVPPSANGAAPAGSAPADAAYPSDAEPAELVPVVTGSGAAADAGSA